MQIPVAQSSSNFHLGSSYAKKISFYFLAICANFPCTIEKYELEALGVNLGYCILL